MSELPHFYPNCASRMITDYPVFQLFVRQFKCCILALLSLQNVPVHVPVSLILEVLKRTEN